jgi:hypothetical protein
MARSTNALDGRPGSLPEISTDGDSIIFEIAVVSDQRIPPGARLLVRCDQAGNVLARIAKAARSPKDS